MMYTKNQIKGVAEMWKNESKQNIAKSLRLKPAQVNYLANELRKAGYKLPRKRMIGQTRLLVQEVVKELNA